MTNSRSIAAPLVVGLAESVEALPCEAHVQRTVITRGIEWKSRLLLRFHILQNISFNSREVRERRWSRRERRLKDSFSRGILINASGSGSHVSSRKLIPSFTELNSQIRKINGEVLDEYFVSSVIDELYRQIVKRGVL